MKKKRKCLKYQKMFNSAGPGNRICPICDKNMKGKINKKPRRDRKQD